MQCPYCHQLESRVVDSRLAAAGTVTVRRPLRAGDVIDLHLPVEPRLTVADPRIDAVRGCVAVERGPEVLCLESLDLAAATDGRDDVADVRLHTAEPPRVEHGRVVASVTIGDPEERSWPYGAQESAPAPSRRYDVELVPYHDWANRGPGTMRVWLPTTP